MKAGFERQTSIVHLLGENAVVAEPLAASAEVAQQQFWVQGRVFSHQTMRWNFHENSVSHHEMKTALGQGAAGWHTE